MSPRRPAALETLEFDHLELWVGNAKQAAHYYCTAFGFEPLAYARYATVATETTPASTTVTIRRLM